MAVDNFSGEKGSVSFVFRILYIPLQQRINGFPLACSVAVVASVNQAQLLPSDDV